MSSMLSEEGACYPHRNYVAQNSKQNQTQKDNKKNNEQQIEKLGNGWLGSAG